MPHRRLGQRLSQMFAVLSVTLTALVGVQGMTLNVFAAGNENTLQQDVSTLQAAGPISVVALTNNSGAVTKAVAGTAQLGTDTPVSVDTHYRTGSITKTFVATTILQLVGEGRLSLDDTVDHWLPGVITGNGNDGSQITIRQLLNHTSGLFDYTVDNNFFATIGTADGFYANRFNQYTPQDLINIALAHAPVAAPGTAWAYSNTNYVVAGEVIKAVTGHDWSVEVTNRIITPLGLTQTSIPGSVTTLPTPYAHAYNIYTSNQNNRVYSDTTDDNMSWAGAAGSIITTTSDEAKFFSALMGGQLLMPAQLAQMQTTVPITSTVGYGLGLVRSKICGQDIWWHNGGTVGNETWAGTTPDGSRTLVYDLSTTSLTGSDTAYVRNTSGVEDALTRHAFCGSSSSNDSITQQAASLHASSPLY